MICTLILATLLLLISGCDSVTFLQNPYQIGTFRQPYGIAIDGLDNLYVADDGWQQIFKLTANGTRVAAFNTSSLGFSYPQGLAIDYNNFLYVADQGNHRIVKLTANGTLAAIYNSSTLNYPKGITVDLQGNIYVTDFGNRNGSYDAGPVIKLGSNGTVLQIYTTVDPQLDHPNGVIVDSMQNVYDLIKRAIA